MLCTRELQGTHASHTLEQASNELGGNKGAMSDVLHVQVANNMNVYGGAVPTSKRQHAFVIYRSYIQEIRPLSFDSGLKTQNVK